jgi:hypothetical protein
VAELRAQGLRIGRWDNIGFWFSYKAVLLEGVEVAFIVIALGALAGLVLIWSRVGWESLRRREHPWRVLALSLGVVALIFVLSALGVRLPRE